MDLRYGTSSVYKRFPKPWLVFSNLLLTTSTRKRGILKLFQVMGFLQVGSVLQKVPQRRQEEHRTKTCDLKTLKKL